MSQGTTKGIAIDTDGGLSSNSDFLTPSQKAVKTYADTKEDGSNKKTTMTGNEASNTFFLSAKAIYDWAIGLFALKTEIGRKFTAYDNTTSSVTGTTSETVVRNLLIPGGSIGSNGVLEINSITLKTSGTTSAATLRVYLSTDATNTVGSTGTPTNSTQIGTYTYATAANVYVPFARRFANKNSESLNEILLTSSSQVSNTYTNINTSISTLNIDTSVDLYYVETMQLVNAADTISSRDTQLYINKP